MSANYRESFIQPDENSDTVLMPPPAMMEDLKKQLIDEFEAPTPVKPAPTVKLSPPGYMDVYLKVRPFSQEELDDGESQGCFQDRHNNTVAMHAPKDSKTFKNVAHGQGKATHSFTFTSVFGEKTTQQQFFDQSTLPIIKDFINGQNCLMFTYGVTSAGKTYTLLGTPDNAGILPRALDVVFNSISNRQMTNSNLMPRLFREVVSMTPGTANLQIRIKDKVMKMATDDEPNITALLGADADNTTIISLNDSKRPSMNHFSLDSLASVQSKDSLKSMVSSMPSIDEEEVADFQSMERAEQMLAEADNRVREETRLSVELASEMKFSIWVSFAEIYNENIHDLLEPLPTKKNARRVVLRLKEDEKGIPFVKGLKWIQVADGDEAFKILTIGRRNLQVACTKLNKSSSRSHCIFSMKMIRTADTSQPHMARVNMLSFVDLAGSERYSKTKNVGAQLREAAHINTSLLTLGRCLETLRFNQHHKMSQKMVPFRESRLTRLFQSFFTGEGKAAMIVNINQNASMFDETLHALKFSAIAKQVTVVQKPEPEKKPPPAPANKHQPLRKKKKSSVVLAKAVRDSVPWGSPASLQRYMEMEENEKTFEEEPPEVEELVSTIEELTQQLKEEKMRAAMMEVKIREEVSQEMSKYIVKIENEYSERIEDVRQFEEDRADQRIDLYINTVKKKKRRRDDEPEEEGNEMEETNKSLRAKLEELDDELSEARSDLGKALSEKDTLREELSKVQFELAGMKELATDSDPTKISESELIDNLGRKLEEAQDTIREQSEQNVELNELLTEAGQTFQEKEVETERLKATIFDDERQLKEQTETILDLRKMVVEARNTIEQLERQVKDQQQHKRVSINVTNQFDETMNFELREKVVNLEEVVAEKKTKMVSLEEAKASLVFQKENLESNNRNLMTQLESSTENFVRMAEEKAQMASELNAAKVRIHELEQKMEVEVKQMNAKISTDKKTNLEKMTQISKDLETKELELKTCDSQLKALKREVAEIQKTKGKISAELESVKNGLKIKEIERNNLKSEHEKSKKELDMILKEIKGKKSELDSLESDVKIGRKGQKNLSETQKELKSLKSDNESLNSAIKQKDDEIKSLNEKLELKKSANQCYYEKMCKLETELEELQANFEKCEDENEELVQEKTALEQVANQLSEKMNETQQQLQEMTDAMSTLENHLKGVESEKSQYCDKMKSLENDTSSLVTEKQKLESEVEKLNSRTGELYSMLKVANDKEVKLKNEKAEKCSKIAELEQSLEELDTALSQESQTKSRLADEVSALKSKLMKCEKSMSDAGSQTSKVEFYTEKLSVEMHDLVHEREELTSKIESLEKELSSLKVELRGYEDINREKCTLETQSEKLELNLAELEKCRDDLKAQLEKFENEMPEKNAELEKLHSELANSKETVSEITELSKELRSETDALKSEMEDLRTKITNSEKIIKEKEEECAGRSVAIAALNSEITEMKSELIAKDNKLNKFEKTSKNLNEQSEKCHDLESKIQDLLQKVDESESKIQDLSQKLENYESKIQDLSQKLEKSESSLISAVQGRDRAEEQNENLDQEIQTLRSEYATLLEKYSDEVESFEKEIEKAKELVEKEKEERVMAETGRKIAEECLEKWKEESTEKNDKESSEELSCAREEVNQLQAQVRSLNQEIENMLAERDQIVTIVRAMRKDALNKSLNSESRSMTAVTKRVEAVIESGHKLQSQLKAARDQNAELQSEVSQLNSRLEAQTVSFERLRSRIEECEQTEKSSESRRMKEVVGERDKLKQELADSRKQMEELRLVNDQLKDGLKEADESAQIEEEERKRLEKQLAELKASRSMEDSLTKSVTRNSRLRLAPRNNNNSSTSGAASPAVRLFSDSKESMEEDEENVDPEFEETRLAERCVQANLVSPSSPRPPSSPDLPPSNCRAPSSAEAKRGKAVSSPEKSPDMFVSPETPPEKLPSRPVRSSARKTKSRETAPAVVKTEPANTGRTRKRCLMKSDPILDVSPDNSLESQTSMETNEVEASVRRRLRTRRK